MLRIYKASAGSGKTYTLAYEYIRLLLGERDEATGRMRLRRSTGRAHRHILAITFTVKATEEMKKRIIHELAVLAGHEPGWTAPSPYAADLMRELGCTADSLREAAAEALRAVLFDFGFFSISTIDSFFQTVLRTFAREAELSGNFDVEIDDSFAVTYGVNEMLSSLDRSAPGDAEARHLGNWLLNYMNSLVDNGNKFDVFNRQSQTFANLALFVRKMVGEEFMKHYDEMIAFLSDSSKLTALARAFADKIAAVRRSAIRAAADALGAIEASPSGSLVTANARKLFVKWSSDDVSPRELGTTVTKIREDVAAAFKKAYTSGTDTALEGAIARGAEAIVGAFYMQTALRAVSSQLYILGLLGNIFAHISDFCKDNELMLLKNTTSLLHGIIGEDDAPFVYERIGQEFKHFLIDEFQDTSALQWENLRPLLSNSLADDSDSLIIGDEKQCIYRFRDSDPDLLTGMAGEFPDKSMPLKDDLRGNTNWRSAADVVRFNNTIFSAVTADLPALGDVYGNVVQPVSPSHATHAGYVKLTGIAGDRSPRKDGDAPGAKEAYEAAVLDILVSDIARQLAAGYRPADIAVLVRTKAQGKLVIDTLMERQAELGRDSLRIVSDDSLRIDSSPTVRLIVSVLRFIASNGAAASTSSSRKAAEIARLINRYEVEMSRGQTPGDALVTAAVRSDEVAAVAARIAGMRCVNLTSIVELIIDGYVGADRLSAENAFITAFQDLVVSFTSRGASDLQSFLEWWDLTGHKTPVVSAPDANALCVITIHKSKGLEYSCVHVPFVNARVPGFKDSEWFDTTLLSHDFDVELPLLLPVRPASWMKEMPQFRPQYERLEREQIIDELNVIYVAFTRAVDELCVSYCDTVGTTGEIIGRAVLRACDPAFADALAARLPEPLEVTPFITLTPAGTLQPGDDSDATAVSVFTAGAPTTPRARQAARRTALEPSGTMIMEPYYTLDRDDLWANTRIDDMPDFDEARDRGVMLHRLLSLVTDAASLDRAVMTAVRRGYIPAGEAPAIAAVIAPQLESEPVRGWFVGCRRVLRERDIVAGGQALRRPDRVVWTADGHVDVVDFKFGRENHARYARQVRDYMRLLRESGHAAEPRGFIWYVAEGRVVAVD